VLLAVEMADRVLDPDGRRTRRITPPDPRDTQRDLVGDIDAGLPTATLIVLHDTDAPAAEDESGEDDPGKLPLITDSFLRAATGEILQRYGTAFGAQWHADPDRLRTEAVALLQRFGAVLVVPGGLLVRPLVGRYRNTVAAVKKRASAPTLF
jgi:hypothetical protein